MVAEPFGKQTMEIGEAEIKYVRENFQKKYAANISGGVYDERDLNRLRSDDVFVQTYIRGPQRLDEGVDLVHESFKFRKEFGVNDLSEDSFDQWVWDRQGVFYHKRTKSGHKILFLRVKEHKKDASLLPIVKKFFIFWLEKSFQESPLEKVVCLFDMSDAGLSNLDMELIRFILTCFKLYYPTLLEKLLIYEMPWIFNAAWKVIKTWLSAEAIAKIKFVTKSDILTSIDKDKLFEHMGGTDTFDSVQYFPAEAGDASSSNGDGKGDNKKRVTFSDAADSSGAEGVETNINNSASDHRPETSTANNRNVNVSASSNENQSYTGRLLTISPAEELVFTPDPSGRDPSDVITLTNTLPYPIAFKIKTTAPEKYRVRPSTGVVKPGQAYEVHVYLQPGYLNTVIRDKFLVMAMEVTSESYDTSLWKTVPKESIMEHRLRCTIGPRDQQAGLTTEASGLHHQRPVPGFPNVGSAPDALAAKIEMLIESNNQLRRRMGWLIISHIVFFLLFILFFATFFCMGEELFTSYLYFPFGFCMASPWSRRC